MLKRHAFLGLGTIAVFLTVSNCTEYATNTATNATAAATPQPVRVLLRNRNTGMLAVDGFLFQVHLLTTADNEDLKDQLMLRSGPTMSVQEEGGMEYRSPAGDKQTPTPVTWTFDPKDFDFFITWTVDSVEQKKVRFGADLVIAVKEEWKVDKVSDPSITKTWNCSYTIRARAGSKQDFSKRRRSSKPIRRSFRPADRSLAR